MGLKHQSSDQIQTPYQLGDVVLSYNEQVTPMSGLHEMYPAVFSQGSITEGERNPQPRRDLNPQSSDPKSDTLSIRPHGPELQ